MAFRARTFALATAAVSLGLLVAVSMAELTLRLLAEATPVGPRVRSTTLAPNEWDALRHHMEGVWNNASHDLSYLVYDEDLGWTLGVNRASANGMYFSGPEGLRTSRVGEAVLTEGPKRRIAIVGDSYTFGEEVPNDDSFPAKLQEMLGPEFQVLNFGVPGFGVDQAYLRHRRDALPWKPEVSVLAFISDDLRRTMGVYTFVGNPDWHMPFSKPRAVPTEDGVRWINLPTLPPGEMFNRKRISHLPYLQYDAAYHDRDWDPTLKGFPYLIRYLSGKLRYMTQARDSTQSTADTFDVNEALVRNFVREARENGSIPIVVYLPGNDRTGLGLTFLRSRNIDHFDATSCLTNVDPSERFTVINPHFSPKANTAIGHCLGEHILRTLNDRTPTARIGTGG